MNRAHAKYRLTQKQGVVPCFFLIISIINGYPRICFYGFGGWVKVYHEIEPGFSVTHVEDNGLGMSAENQKHMFEKFFRAEAAKSAIGTGLKRGEGSRFNFSLPRPAGSAAKTKI